MVFNTVSESCVFRVIAIRNVTAEHVGHHHAQLLSLPHTPLMSQEHKSPVFPKRTLVRSETAEKLYYKKGRGNLSNKGG